MSTKAQLIFPRGVFGRTKPSTRKFEKSIDEKVFNKTYRVHLNLPPNHGVAARTHERCENNAQGVLLAGDVMRHPRCEAVRVAPCSSA